MFAIVPVLAVGMPLDRLITSQVARGVFSSKRKVVLWHSHSVAFLSTYQLPQPAASQEATLIGESTLVDHAKKAPIDIRDVRYIVLEPQCRHSVLVTTFASDISAVKPRILKKSKRIICIFPGVIDILSVQAFHILLSNFSAKAMHLPK